MLQPGSVAPDFSLFDADMEMLKLSKLRGKTVVLYFYPKDDTPGCTVEAIEFSDLEDEFIKHNTLILGVSRDDCISHADFVCVLARAAAIAWPKTNWIPGTHHRGVGGHGPQVGIRVGRNEIGRNVIQKCNAHRRSHGWSG